MTVQRHDRPDPAIERTFMSVRAALPAASVAAFDAELEAITRAPVANLPALDDFLSGWWRIATRAAADPADWQRMHQEAAQLQSGARRAGPTLAEVLGRRGVRLQVHAVRIGSDIAEAQIGDLSDAETGVLREIHDVLRLTPGDGRKLVAAGNMYVWDHKGISVAYLLLSPQREVAILRVDRFPT